MPHSKKIRRDNIVPEAILPQRDRLVMVLFLKVTMLALAMFAVYHYFAGQPAYVPLLLSFVLLFSLVIYQVNKRRLSLWLFRPLVCFAVVAILAAGYYGGEQGFMMIWVLVLPSFLPVLFGAREGAAWLFFLWLITVAAMFFSDRIPGMYQYPVDVAVRIAFAFALISVLSVLGRGAMEKSDRKLNIEKDALERARQQQNENNTLLQLVNQRLTDEIESRAALEAQLIHAKKMEVVGLMAGGVAHDLNNTLAGLVSYPELLLLDLEPDDDMRAPLELIKNSGERAAEIVKDLLTLSRRGGKNHRVLDLLAVGEEFHQSLELKTLRARKPAVDWHYMASSEPLPVIGSRSAILKVLLNLCTNAFEAVSETGTVSVELASIALREQESAFGTIPAGEYVMLNVKDDGMGLSSADRTRIFEPFFTRKMSGSSGTGLGMTVVWNLVEDHGGVIDLASGQDEGTEIRVYFPAASGFAEVGNNPQSPWHSQLGEGEKILVVDDMAVQREVAQEMLGTLGYQPSLSNSGEEAVEFMIGHSADLIILDMVMDPGMNGIETMAAIRKIKPDQRVLISSGFTGTATVEDAIAAGANGFLPKPYSLAELAKAVREVMG